MFVDLGMVNTKPYMCTFVGLFMVNTKLHMFVKRL